MTVPRGLGGRSHEEALADLNVLSVVMTDLFHSIFFDLHIVEYPLKEGAQIMLL